MSAPELDEPDPRRWFTLAVVITAVLIAALDTTILNVAIPTILREFHTDLPSLQWVITGYSLMFASLLIIGGRLGDLFGARRMFIIGAALFTVGSFDRVDLERRPDAGARRGHHRGHRRVADAAGDPRDPVVDLHRPRPWRGLLHVGRDRWASRSRSDRYWADG